MISEPVTVKKKLAVLRIENGLSQEEVAKAIGVAQGSISMYETGYRTPSMKNAQKLADLYGVTIDAIDFTGWRKKNNDDEMR